MEERCRRLIEKMGLQGAAASGGGAGKGVASKGRTGGCARGTPGMTAEPDGKTAAPGAETPAGAGGVITG